VSLETFQRTIKQLYTALDAQATLTSSESLNAFLATTDLTSQEKRGISTISLDRLEQYRFMLLANAQEMLESFFPMVHSLLQDEWDAVVQDYVYHFPSRSFKVMSYGVHFASYLKSRTDLLADIPYLAEIAEYERIEAELLDAPHPAYSKALQPIIPVNKTELKHFGPVLNQTASLIQAQYPLPDILEQLNQQCTEMPESIHCEPAATYLWVFRNSQPPYGCHYSKLNVLLVAWLTTAWEAHKNGTVASYHEILYTVYQALQVAMPELDYDDCVSQFLSVLKQLYEQGIVVGSVRIKER
jgi:hypothetical protein